MRWEVLTAKIDERQAANNQPHRLESLLMWIYSLMLKLYPPAFRSAFADEMTDVFAMSLRETRGRVGLALILLHEVAGLPLSLLAVHRQIYKQLPAKVQQRHQVRWFVRIIGGLLGLFLLSTLTVILSPSYNLYTQAIPFVVMLCFTSTSMLLSIIWGRWGGLLTGGGGVTLGIFMSLYVHQIATSGEVSPLGMIMIGVLWALPFVIFGALFYQLSGQPLRSVTTC